MAQAISIADKPESRNTVQEVIQKGLRSSVRRGATQVLSYLLDQGAEISTITAGAIMNTEELVKSSREVLEILIARGWDINSWGPNCND
jgi:predicted type IV restriction endonuclease